MPPKRDWSKDSRPNKARARVFGFEADDDMPLRSIRALMMPGRTCEDIRIGLDMGVFTEDSEIVAVEHDPDEYEYLCDRAKELPCRIIPVFTKLHTYQPEGSFDLLSLDFCGELNRDNANWISRYHSCLKPGGTLLWTMVIGTRSNPYLDEQDQYFRKGFGRQEYDQFTRGIHIDHRIHLPEFLLRRLTGNRFNQVSVFRYQDTVSMIVFRMN